MLFKFQSKTSQARMPNRDNEQYNDCTCTVQYSYWHTQSPAYMYNVMHMYMCVTDGVWANV